MATLPVPASSSWFSYTVQQFIRRRGYQCGHGFRNSTAKTEPEPVYLNYCFSESQIQTVRITDIISNIKKNHFNFEVFKYAAYYIYHFGVRVFFWRKSALSVLSVKTLQRVTVINDDDDGCKLLTLHSSDKEVGSCCCKLTEKNRKGEFVFSVSSFFY